MSKFNKTGRKALSVFMSVATVTWLVGAPLAASAAALTQSQIDSIIVLLQNFGADSTTINNVRTSLSGGTPTGGSTGGSSSVGSCGFTRDLSVAGAGGSSTGEDVRCLQKYLNGAGHQIAASGAGSPGNETTNFGNLTKAAVMKWQAAAGITPAAGYFGAKSRAAYNAMAGGTTPPGTTPPPASTGTGLVVSKGEVTPPGGLPLAYEGAARIPFTKVMLTASSDGDVVVNSITVERGGGMNDAAIAGVVLLDENGNQIGLSRTLNSDHRANLTDSFTVKAGQTRSMIIGANMNASLDSYAGQVGTLKVVAVNTSAVVNGALPIEGTAYTANSTLAIGTATMQLGPSDPNSALTKEVGTTGVTFAAVKVTAGSAEKVKLHSVRWNQTGSAGASDLANLKTYVDGVAYDVVASSDGKYFVANFGGGLIIDKGLSKEVVIKGDIISGSGRTIFFDIDKATDVNVSGDTYQTGITPTASSTGSASDTSSEFTTGTPFFDASKITVSAGSIVVSKATSVTSQNIAVNLADQPLGGVDVEVKGEQVTVQSTVFRISMGSVTDVKLVGPTGNIVAGPVDATAAGVATFSTSITYPIGKGTYKLVGKIPSGTATNRAITSSTTPATSASANLDWSSITGQTTGNSIVVSPASTITGNSMTVKTAGITVSVASQPAAQTIVAGGKFTFANVTLDATASGEDLRFSTLPLAYQAYGGSTHLTNCVLKDGSTVLNTGTNEVNPTATGSSTTFTLDNGLNVLKGAVKTLTLECNVPGNITSGAFAWGVDSGATITATGLTSSQSATVAINDSNGQKMTVTSAGTFTVTEDTAASLSYRQAYPSSSEVVLARLKFHANNEAIDLTQLSLQLTNVASSSPSDFVGNAVKLYKSDGTTLVGTLVFPNNVASTATNVRASTTVSGFQIPKDADAIMVVKAQLTPIGTSQTGVQGHLISVDYDGTNSASTKGVGVSSGTNMNSSTTSDTAVAGVRVFKTVPTVSHVSNSNPLAAGGNLYQFKVKANPADGNGVYLHKVTFQLATSTSVNIQQFKLYGPNGAVNATAVDTPAISSSVYPLEITFDSTAADRFVGAGEEKIYTLRADTLTTTGSAGAKDSVTIKLLGDDAYPGLSSLDASNSACSDATNANQQGCTAFMNDVTAIDAGTDDNFIWSPQATSTVVTGSNDFTNGYGVPTGSGSDTLTNDLTAQTFERTI